MGNVRGSVMRRQQRHVVILNGGNIEVQQKHGKSILGTPHINTVEAPWGQTPHRSAMEAPWGHHGSTMETPWQHYGGTISHHGDSTGAPWRHVELSVAAAGGVEVAAGEEEDDGESAGEAVEPPTRTMVYQLRLPGAMKVAPKTSGFKSRTT